MTQKRPVFENCANICLKTQQKIILYYKDYIYQLEQAGQDAASVTFKQIDNKQIYKQRQGQVIQQVKKLQFAQIYGITTLSIKTYLILVTKAHRVGQILDYPIYKVDKIQFVQIGDTRQSQSLQDHLKQSFNIISLYYSSYNLTQRLQFSYVRPGYFEHSFCCNHKYTVAYDNYPINLLTKFIFGYAETKQIEAGGVRYSQTLISRGNFNSAGRRRWRRGLDQKGYAATHFQTQFILQVAQNQNKSIYSVVQIRGSVPLLWSQQPNFGIQVPYIISQTHNNVREQLRTYLQRQQKLQKSVKMVNLIDKKYPQGILGGILANYMHEINMKNTHLLWFDFHQEYAQLKQRSFQKFIQEIQYQIEDYGFCKLRKQGDYNCQIVLAQKGTFRTNCIDCLDRTNFIQSIICKIFLLQFFDDYQGQRIKVKKPFQKHKINEIQMAFKELWIKNASEISLQCAGTSAMKLDFYKQGKKTFYGSIWDFMVGSKRYLVGNFIDYYYQNCLDLHFKKIDVELYANKMPGKWNVARRILLYSISTGVFSYLFCKILISRYIKQKSEGQSPINKYGIIALVSGTLLGTLLSVINSEYSIQYPIKRAEYI